MSKKSKSLTNKAGEVRELTRADFKNAKPLRDAFPAMAAYARSRANKGEPTKQAVSIRLSPEVIGYFKSKGLGWQTRIDVALKAFVEAAR
ncbi:unnamed protein product [Sphagnum jensenii]|uniref:BrnA antitoxin family protein n=1 Tax=Sphagnum jensenii TaxID=128206 RepID=A0ABP0VHN3_9BRYO